ncbi:MAG: transposase [Chloroflexota bacterium]
MNHTNNGQGLPHPNRRSIRLKGYDYSQPGAYFVTICTRDRACLFGTVVNGEMRLNEWGEIVLWTWRDLPNHVPNVQLDAFVIMPNHVHGIIIITDPVNAPAAVGAGSEPAPTQPQPAPTQPQPAPTQPQPAPTQPQPAPTQPQSAPTQPQPAPTQPQPAPTQPQPASAQPTPDQSIESISGGIAAKRYGLPEIMRQFKTFSALRINKQRGTPGLPIWQRNYYEHIIRNEESLNRIRQYIADNPLRWALDQENPAGIKPKSERP